MQKTLLSCWLISLVLSLSACTDQEKAVTLAPTATNPAQPEIAQVVSAPHEEGQQQQNSNTTAAVTAAKPSSVTEEEEQEPECE